MFLSKCNLQLGDAEMQSIPGVEARLRCYVHKFAAPHKLKSASQVSHSVTSAVPAIDTLQFLRT